LQFGYGCEQLDDCDFADSILRLPDHVDTDDGAFTDTAAILQNLDLVVTTDTAVAHLAGAVGANVTLMLGRVPDWRWRLEGDATPWYPTMNLVRQPQLGRWDEVVEGVCKQLTVNS
jgi:ADP-heptose:LPS heptosyltransferase